MREINAIHCPGPHCAYQAAIDGGLPCKIIVGQSTFVITEENQRAFWLGIAMATDECWERAVACMSEPSLA